MPKPGRNAPKPEPPAKMPVVIDERPMDKRFAHMKEPGDRNLPIRTVLLMEVADATAAQVRQILAKVNEKYLGNEHPTFVVPLRFGKLTNDVVFEGEFLEIVKKVCEVQDGEIVLKGGCHEVQIIRTEL